MILFSFSQMSAEAWIPDVLHKASGFMSTPTGIARLRLGSGNDIVAPIKTEKQEYVDYCNWHWSKGMIKCDVLSWFYDGPIGRSARSHPDYLTEQACDSLVQMSRGIPSERLVPVIMCTSVCGLEKSMRIIERVWNVESVAIACHHFDSDHINIMCDFLRDRHGVRRIGLLGLSENEIRGSYSYADWVSLSHKWDSMHPKASGCTYCRRCTRCSVAASNVLEAALGAASRADPVTMFLKGTH